MPSKHTAQSSPARFPKQACAFIWSEREEGTAATWGPGAASRVWLHHALHSLDSELRTKHGSGIIFAAGDRHDTLLDLSRKLVRARECERSTGQAQQRRRLEQKLCVRTKTSPRARGRRESWKGEAKPTPPKKLRTFAAACPSCRAPRACTGASATSPRRLCALFPLRQRALPAVLHCKTATTWRTFRPTLLPLPPHALISPTLRAALRCRLRTLSSRPSCARPG